jgi:hypothetical protein
MKFPTDNSVGYMNKFLLFSNAFCSLEYHPFYLVASIFPILLNNLIAQLFNVRKFFNYSVVEL